MYKALSIVYVVSLQLSAAGTSKAIVFPFPKSTVVPTSALRTQQFMTN